jgi:hypothetical protein
MSADVILYELADLLVVENEKGFLPGRRAVYERLTDSVEVHHVPGWPGDGPMTPDVFLTLGEREDVAWLRAMPDFHQEDVSATVDGVVIELKRTLCGTLADGSDIRIPLRNLYYFNAGRIERIVPHLDPTVMTSIKQVLLDGGFDAEIELEIGSD